MSNNGGRAPETQLPSAPGIHTCTTCGRSYARIDHLKRHIRAHTQSKPFECTICGKAFARVDSLKRHSASHDPAGPRRQGSSQIARARTGKACQSCASSKLRCEDEKPCKRCRQRGIECIYNATSPPSTTSQWRPSNATDLHDFPMTMATPNILPNTSLEESDFEASTQIQSHQAIGHYSPADSAMVDIRAEMSLAEFLNDIMLPLPSTFTDERVHDAHTGQDHLGRDYLDFGTSWADMADFEAMLAETDVPSMTRQNNVSFNLAHAPSGTKTPIFGESFGARNAAFSRSVWRWVPTKRDRGGANPMNLSLPAFEADSPETRTSTETLLPHQHIEQSLRDKLLALILSTCEQATYPLVVAAFPSAELLDNIMHYSLNTHFARIDSWIHVPSLIIDKNLELLTVIIAAGAVLSSSSPIRRLGFALQEASRTATANKFEDDNQTTRDLSTVQGLVLGLHIGFWSGDKRKMEIAESFALPPITMLRRAGRFLRRKNEFIAPNLEDADEVLEEKWHAWAQMESYKRLAIHLLIHDAQKSMAQQVAPLIFASEMTLDLPCPRELWSARNAREWCDIFLRSRLANQHEKSISISQGISHLEEIRIHQGIDVSLSAMLVVHSLWAAVWNHMQLTSLVRGQNSRQSPTGNFLTSFTWDSGLSQLLDQISVILADWDEPFRHELALVLERTILSLHVSFEQMQYFAGKGGEEEARRAFPALQRWAVTKDARKAVWCAGQILRAAARARNHLRDFRAICVYHASMTFWTYSVLLGFPKTSQRAQSAKNSTPRSAPASVDSEVVWLDGSDGPAVQRFIALNRGYPVVSNLMLSVHDTNSQPIPLDSPKAVMDVCVWLLRRNTPAGDEAMLMPLVENLSQLMQDLGKAAQELQGHVRRSRSSGVTPSTENF